MWDGILSTGTELPPPHPPSTSHHSKDHEQKQNLSSPLTRAVRHYWKESGQCAISKKKGGQCVISKEKKRVGSAPLTPSCAQQHKDKCQSNMYPLALINNPIGLLALIIGQ